MKLKNIGGLLFLIVSYTLSWGQTKNSIKDSLYINQIENHQEPDKVLHAEPLYIDLIRDLGARKGEKEWNIGLGISDNLKFDSYEALIEYEFAPINRLGFEIELPFTFYSPLNNLPKDSIPSAGLNSLKMATQWSFWVNERWATSMALGYINEIELNDFRHFGKPFITGNVYNPFLVIAKRWGQNFHSLMYTGPTVHHSFDSQPIHVEYEMNTSFHFMISGTRNFVGLEINKTYQNEDLDITLRPQMRLAIAPNLMIGIVVGIPLYRENQGLSSFIRLIWEPGHKH